MEFNDINSIIDRYFDGVSSQEDEQTLARYFDQHSELPEEHQAVKAMFESFASLRATTLPESSAPKSIKTRVTINSRVLGRAASIAAAVGVIAIVAALTLVKHSSPTTSTEELICYVDGVKIEDQRIARAETERILGGVSTNLETAMLKVSHITNISSSHKQ